MQPFYLFHHHKQQVFPMFLMFNILYVCSNHGRYLYFTTTLFVQIEQILYEVRVFTQYFQYVSSIAGRKNTWNVFTRSLLSVIFISPLCGTLHIYVNNCRSCAILTRGRTIYYFQCYKQHHHRIMDRMSPKVK